MKNDSFGTARRLARVVHNSETFGFPSGEKLVKKNVMKSGSWSLTNADLLFCTVPIVIFLSIVSFV